MYVCVCVFMCLCVCVTHTCRQGLCCRHMGKVADASEHPRHNGRAAKLGVKREQSGVDGHTHTHTHTPNTQARTQAGTHARTHTHTHTHTHTSQARPEGPLHRGRDGRAREWGAHAVHGLAVVLRRRKRRMGRTIQICCRADRTVER